MTRIKFLFSFIALIITSITFSQNTHTLVTIGDQNYSIEEFDFIYNKNNSYTEDPKSKKEYVDLFVNYKLKVHEAIAQGLDTMPSFKTEYNYYKDELAKPYLSDKSITENLKKEAYERLNQEVNASHILIRLPKSATPEDTLKAYNKIKSIQERIKNGEDFNKLAQELSEDPSAKKNMGKLGFFSGFMMVYPFENAAYNTPVNQVSDIVKTSFGYHLIKVHDKRKARGELRTAHIMLMFPPNASADVIEEKKAKIDSIYQLVLKGEDFGSLAQNFSEDRKSATNNGELPWFGSGRMIPEFSEPAFKLDTVGAISEVIRTPYGFHIIKLLEKRGTKSYDEMEEEITQKISRDERAFKGKQSVINRLKKEYNYTQNDSIINAIKENAKLPNISDADFFASLKDPQLTIVSFDSKDISIKDLTEYLQSNRQFTKNRKAAIIDQLLDTYLEEQILDFEKSQLENKYPEYRFLLNEYHDGLLIFEISQKEIWNKASADTTGIKNYYNSHKEDYFEPEKLVGKAYFTKDKSTLKSIQAQLQVTPNITTDSLKQIIPATNFKCINGTFSKGEYAAIDKNIWNIKKSEGKIDTDFPYVFASGETVPKKYKQLEETKGQVISDYQNEIEKQWIARLKEKYNPIINIKALKFSKNNK
ncbi:peptidylprolyl isomerase [Plebeiibacterium sediminum]|uniref:Peptidyl-prolyl cis-trans isomerase n=1 Tax=Plebeiibacterium sediminum TaxID=2992112 RepID=A0AAE3M2P5_9BACT|nr:peptidylprolyl isomerase [Plebeiobacterium sediminum]MCW3786029.1 peptidyl-prolyl cis-trans isomerase [Plebeiobacterium sediminum]